MTVAGDAEDGSTVRVMVGGQQVCETPATGGAFTCEFTATEEMDGQPITVTATDAAGNTSYEASSGTMQVDGVVDPAKPTITLKPAEPVAGEPVQIEVTGDEGDEVVVKLGTTEVCRTIVGADGTATCEWKPAAEGEVTLRATVGDQTVEKTVTVRPADSDDDNAGSGSLDMGSLQTIIGGSSGSSGSLGS